MIPYNITLGTKVRNINTGKETVFNGKSGHTHSTPFAKLADGRKILWHNFSRNYELANQANPSLMTSIG